MRELRIDENITCMILHFVTHIYIEFDIFMDDLGASPSGKRCFLK